MRNSSASALSYCRAQQSDPRTIQIALRSLEGCILCGGSVGTVSRFLLRLIGGCLGRFGRGLQWLEGVGFLLRGLGKRGQFSFEFLHLGLNRFKGVSRGLCASLYGLEGYILDRDNAGGISRFLLCLFNRSLIGIGFGLQLLQGGGLVLGSFSQRG